MDNDNDNDNSGPILPSLSTLPVNKHLMVEVDRLKQIGNAHFGKREYTKAIEYYNQAINCVDQNCEPLHILYCNLSMFLYHRTYFNDLLLGIFYCDKAIDINQIMLKLIFEIKLSTKIGDDKLASNTINKARKLFPNNAGINNEYIKMTKKMKKQNAKNKS